MNKKEMRLMEKSKSMKAKIRGQKKRIGAFSFLVLMVSVMSGAIYVGVLVSGPQSRFFHRYLVSSFTEQNDDVQAPTVSTSPPVRDLQ